MDRANDEERAFSLRPLDAYWVSGPPGDTCSHGYAELVFGGRPITPTGRRIDHSPSKAAWMLLPLVGGPVAAGAEPRLHPA